MAWVIRCCPPARRRKPSPSSRNAQEYPNRPMSMTTRVRIHESRSEGSGNSKFVNVLQLDPKNQNAVDMSTKLKETK